MIEDLLSLVDDASPFPYSGLPASTPDRDHNDDDDDSCQDYHHHYDEDDDDHHEDDDDHHEDDDRHNCMIESIRTCLQAQELAILGLAEANHDTSREGTER